MIFSNNEFSLGTRYSSLGAPQLMDPLVLTWRPVEGHFIEISRYLFKLFVAIISRISGKVPEELITLKQRINDD